MPAPPLDGSAGAVRQQAPFDVLWRAYSITSATADTQLEYYGIAVPDGAFTSAVRQLKRGDPILLDKVPNGFLTIDRFTGGDDLWMLATGTGLGPYIALLRDPAVWRRFGKLVLVHGVRHGRELAYQATLASLAAQAATRTDCARLYVVQATTRESMSAPVSAPVNQSGMTSTSLPSTRPAIALAPDGLPDPANQPALARLQGRITTLLASGMLEAAAGLAMSPETSRILLCGNPAMIDDMRGLLQLRGFLPVRRAQPGHFMAENYW